MDMFLPVQFWHWFALALILLIAEMVAPGIFFLWVALAAVITGGVLFVAPELSLMAQILLFGFSAFVLLVAGRRYAAFYRGKTDEPHLNNRAQSLIGVTFKAPHDLTEGVHPLMIQGTLWQVKTPVAAGGTRLKIVGAEDMTLIAAAKIK